MDTKCYCSSKGHEGRCIVTERVAQALYEASRGYAGDWDHMLKNAQEGSLGAHLVERSRAFAAMTLALFVGANDVATLAREDERAFVLRTLAPHFPAGVDPKAILHEVSRPDEPRRTVPDATLISALYDRLGRLPARVSRTPAQHREVQRIHDWLAELEDVEVAMIEQNVLGTLPRPAEELEAGMDRAQELLERHADEDPSPEQS